MHMSKIVGHRGCAGHAPENTLAGFRHAARMGLSWVEADATLLSDGTVVLFHDDTLDRCTNQTGFIREQKWPDLLSADAGSWFDKGQYVAERVPLLTDALSCLQSLKIGLNLELKTHGNEGEELAGAVMRILKETDYQNILVSSFDLTALKAFSSADNPYRVGVLFEDLPDDWQEIGASHKAVSIHLWAKNISHEQVESIIAEGYEVYVYTVNSMARAKELFAMGVDGIFSDDLNQV